jgi:hypothetical protein
VAHALHEVITNALAIAEAACEVVHKAFPRNAEKILNWGLRPPVGSDAAVAEPVPARTPRWTEELRCNEVVRFIRRLASQYHLR